MTEEKEILEEETVRIPVKAYFRRGADGMPHIDRERTIYGNVPVQALVDRLRRIMPKEWK